MPFVLGWLENEKNAMMSAMLFFLMECCVSCEENVKCYDSDRFISVNLIITTLNDSVSFTLDAGRMDVINASFICKDSSVSSYFVTDTISNMSKYACSRNDSLWLAYHAFAGEPTNRIELNSVKMDMNIYNSGNVVNVDISKFMRGGQILNIITEKDSADWFSQMNHLIRPYFEEYDVPAQANRLGCFGGFCFITFSIRDKEICYDR